jgi:hypothetical protein
VYGYKGELTDPFGMVNLRARVYNPRNYAFLTRDPVEGFLSRSASIIGGTTAVAYDVLINQGVGWSNLHEADWDRAGQVGRLGVDIGFEVALSAGAGVLTASALGRAVAAGHLSRGAAFVAGAAADVGFGVAYDTLVHQNSFADSLLNNALFFGLGEGIGYGVRAFRRGVKTAADSIKLLPAPKVSGLLPERTIPLAFESEDAYRAFSTRLRGMLERAGYDDAEIIFQGSAVTGKSYKTGLPFGKDSDIDIAIASPSMLSAAKSQHIQIRGIHSRPLRMGDMRKLGIDGNELNELSNMVQHNPRYMIYKSTWSAINDKPSIIAPR